jgi:hypothetical protein
MTQYEDTMPSTTYADVARLTDALTPDTAEQWCAARDLSADEAYAIWYAATSSDAPHAEVAQMIWADDTWWRGGISHLVLAGRDGTPTTNMGSNGR